MKYEFFKNVTSKEELYSQYKKLAMEHHPDHGGRVEDMQKINAEYNDLKARVWNTHKSATGETYTSERVRMQRRIEKPRFLLLLEKAGVGVDGRRAEEEQTQIDNGRNPRPVRK